MSNTILYDWFVKIQTLFTGKQIMKKFDAFFNINMA